MTDSEYLELAAKAAGIQFSELGGGARYAPQPGIMQPYVPWNPLTDDGDALRLAVKLDICVEPYSPEGSTIAYLDEIVHKVDEKCESPREWYGTDPYAATRRAIVRAAAEIGRSMK